MRQPSLANPTSSARGLHPILQAALGSLDVQLETELARYRRQRRTPGRGQPAVRGRLSHRQKHKSIDLIAVGAIGGRTQPVQKQPSVSTTTSTTATAAADPFPMLDRDLWEEQTDAAIAAQNSSVAAQPQAMVADQALPIGATSGISRESAASSTKLQPPEVTHQSDPEAADYFASSEELLRSLAEEEVELRSKHQPRGLEGVWTPLGIGSLLLLLLSSVTIGYLIINPSVLKSFSIQTLFNRRHADPIAATSSSPASPSANIHASPDLSTEEFKDLNLGTLSTLSTQSSTQNSPESARSTASPAAATPSSTLTPNDTEGIPGVARQRATEQSTQSPRVSVRSSAPNQISAQPAPRRSSVVPQAVTPRTAPRVSPAPVAPRPARRSVQPPPAPAVSSPSPQPARARVSPTARSAPNTVSVAAAPAAPAASGNLYYVVTDYNGDRSLEQARQTVGDAYVRNFPAGARVQLGAFSDESRARELRQQLEQQGVSAQIYQP